MFNKQQPMSGLTSLVDGVRRIASVIKRAGLRLHLNEFVKFATKLTMSA